MYVARSVRGFPRISADDPVQIYRANDKPYYRTGNKVLIALAVYSAALFLVAKLYYVWRNKYVDTLTYLAT